MRMGYLVLMCGIWGALSGRVPADQPPNIVHVIADDLGWNDVGYHGSDIRTPAIDRLASESIVLERFYATPICSPTRAGVLTGRYPFRFGIWGGVVSPNERFGLPPAEQTTPELLAASGYRHRGLLGKWHLGLASTLFHPLAHGFSEFYGHYNGAIDYFSHHRFGQLDWHRNYDSVEQPGYSTDLVGDAAVEFIERQTGESPFYLLVAFNAPHSPLQATEDDLRAEGFNPQQPRAANTDQRLAEREGAPEYGQQGRGNTIRQTFAAMTRGLDRNLEKILQAIDGRGWRDNTLVVFHSDNGADPKHGGSNQPLRGNKFTMWEGGVRVVAMVRWPDQLPAGQRFLGVTSYIDWLPTQLAASGYPVPPDVDGINLLPQLTGRQPVEDRTLLLGKNAAVSQRWKWVDGELFDLQADPGETRDVAAEHPEQAERFERFTARFDELSGPPFTSGLERPAQWPPVKWQLPAEAAP